MRASATCLCSSGWGRNDSFSCIMIWDSISTFETVEFSPSERLMENAQIGGV
jgi:hypothetical protein